MKWFIVMTIMGITPEGESTGLHKITSATQYSSEALCETFASGLSELMQKRAHHYGLRMIVVTECRETQ